MDLSLPLEIAEKTALCLEERRLHGKASNLLSLG
jgi:hypothetical protein